MEVLDCVLYNWELVDVVDCFRCFWSCRVLFEQLNVLQHHRLWQDGVQGVDRFVSYGPIEDDCVQVEVCNLGLEWYPLQSCAWAPLTFEESLL